MVTAMPKNNKIQTSKASRKVFGLLDAVLIVLLLAVSVVFIFGFVSDFDEDMMITVKKDGEVVYNADLSAVTEPYEICVDDEYKLVLLVEADGVSVLKSDCTDKVCVNTGKLSHSGQSAVCLPARVSIEINGKSANNLDGVVG